VYVKEQMGHASIQITVDIYGHLAPGGNRSAVDRLDSDARIRIPGATEPPRMIATGSTLRSCDL
jgi:integrase